MKIKRHKQINVKVNIYCEKKFPHSIIAKNDTMLFFKVSDYKWRRASNIELTQDYIDKFYIFIGEDRIVQHRIDEL